MRGFKCAVVGGIAGALCATATVAIAGSGVGGVFNLGQGNSVDATSSLAGTTNGSQLNVLNLSTAAAARALIGYAKSPTAAAAVVQNAGGGPALALGVNAGKAPLTVNSSTKVVSLNADQVDGLDSSAFQPHYARTVVVTPVGTATQNGTALKNALAGITTASTTSPWLLKLEPGIYDVAASPLALKANVDVAGSGQGVTTIKGTGGCGSSESVTVSTVVAVELRDLTVKNTGGCAYATAIRSDSLPLRLRSVTATASGGTSETRGILLAGERGAKLTQVTADADGTGSSLAIAVKLVYSPADSLDDVDAHAYGASPSGGNTALLLENSYALVRSSWLETRRASDPTVQSTQDSFVTVLWSLLDGGVPVRDFGSETTCGADFNHNDPVAVVAC